MEGVRWQQALSGKWHAVRGDETRSVCTLVATRRSTTPGPEAPPDGRQRCYWCRKELGITTHPTRHEAPTRRQEAQVEFIGGALDGMRVTLVIIEETPDRVRIVGRTYSRRPVPQELRQPY